VLGLKGEQVTELTVSGSAGSYSSAWEYTNIFGGLGLLATYAWSDTANQSSTYFALNDWLGTKRAEVGAEGCVSTFTSMPYGNDLLPSTLTGYSPCPDATEHHFTGKERDAESGNDYFGARYYASTMGRWLSPDWSAKEDPVPYAVLDDPQSLNLYQFVRNNPLSNRDDDGHGCPPDCGDPTAVTQVAPPSRAMDILMLPISGTIGMLKAGYNALLSGNTPANRKMGIPDTPAMQPANDGEKAGMTVAPLVVAAGVPELAPEATAMEAADVGTMASQLSKETGVTRVDLSTPEMRTNVDLVGKPHFDKATGEYINTPHVQSRPISVGPNGKINLGPQTTRPATAADIQAAQKVLKKNP
jgi:RHS repeat-associated protein